MPDVNSVFQPRHHAPFSEFFTRVFLVLRYILGGNISLHVASIQELEKVVIDRLGVWHRRCRALRTFEGIQRAGLVLLMYEYNIRLKNGVVGVANVLPYSIPPATIIAFVYKFHHVRDHALSDHCTILLLVLLATANRSRVMSSQEKVFRFVDHPSRMSLSIWAMRRLAGLPRNVAEK